MIPAQDEGPEPNPLLTAYATSDAFRPPARQFSAIPRETLDKLLLIRKWPVDPVANPIPFKRSALVRDALWDVLEDRQTDEPIVVKEFQKQAVHHLIRMPRFILGDAVGLGKAQPLTAGVLTPQGWKSMGGMRVGSRVIDPDGGEAVVTGVFPQGERPVYRVETTDGAVTECCGDHLWTVQTADDRCRRRGWRTWTTDQIIEYGLHRRGSRWKVARVFLPVTEPVTFRPTSGRMRIPPYSLGALLGDGSLRNGVGFNSVDAEIVERIRGELPPRLRVQPLKTDPSGWSISQGNTNKSCGGNEYLSALRRLKLAGAYSHDKFVPKRYLRASVEERIELLRGLMDTDGGCVKSGLAYFHSTSERLVQDVIELVRSLGGFTRFSKVGPGRYRKAGVLRVCRKSWTLTVKTPFNPFHLLRKASRWRVPCMARAIKSITPVGRKPVQCIKVTSKRSLYVTDGYIVTHNTLDVLVAFAWLKEKNPEAKMVVVTTKSTTYQWTDEVKRYTTLRARVMTDTHRGLKSSAARYSQMIEFLEGGDHDIIVAKYDSLKGSRAKQGGPDGKPAAVSEEIENFARIFKEHRSKTVLALDEAHRFAHTGTQVRQLVMAVSRWPERVWALTATSIKNSLDEFYSISCAIGVRPLGGMREFRDEYCIWREQHIGNGRTVKLISGYKNVAFFKEQIRPFFLGRSQKQVNEPLPRLTTRYHPIDLDEKQAKILRELPLGLVELPPILFKVAGEVFERERDGSNEMTQLSVQQMVVNHWALLDRNNPESFLTRRLSPKEEALRDMLGGEYRGEKVVVYSKFRSWIDRLEWLAAEGILTDRKFLRITGNESEKKRNENKRLFQSQDSGHDLMVLNAAGMEGINLQQAAHMILLDVPWSWGDLIQLVGRMVRMASPHSACTLHVFVAKGTIDEYAVDTLKGKKGVFEAVLGESHSAGLLDERDDLDLASGMEQSGTEAEFKSLLRAHCKRLGMRVYLSGEQIEKALGDVEYKMVFERDGGKPGRKRRKADDLTWFLQ